MKEPESPIKAAGLTIQEAAAAQELIEASPPRVAVYVPAEGMLGLIEPKSGIVGAATVSGDVWIYYEGNLYGAVNLGRYVERVLHAWGRLNVGYPTVAKALVRPHAIRQIGWYDVEATAVVVFPGGAINDLAEWLGIDPADGIPESELVL